METEIAIILFCKVPETGRVKTRLVTDKFSSEDAKNLQIEMIKDTLIVLESLPFKFQLIISYFPENKKEKLLDVVEADNKGLSKSFIESIVYFPQTKDKDKDTVGKRFDESFRNAFSLENIKSAFILATDTPHLDTKKLISAYNHLSQKENCVVIGPSQKGGFYLFGLNNSDINLTELFDKPNEFSNLLEIAYNNKLVPEILPFLFDIDTIQDLYTIYSTLKPIVIANEILIGEKIQIPERTFNFLKNYFQDEF